MTATDKEPEDKEPEDKGDVKGEDKAAAKSVRLFHDDTFKGFFRRLQWSNDGRN